jgi:hypothetical protein
MKLTFWNGCKNRVTRRRHWVLFKEKGCPHNIAIFSCKCLKKIIGTEN